MTKLANIIFILSCLITTIAIAAEERDPFKPYTWSAPSGGEPVVSSNKGGEINNPLTDKPISAYTVVGVVVSPSEAIAVLKSRDKREYFAYIGDKIGIEGGIVSTIDTEGVTIDLGGKIIPMKISNRFEVQNDNTIEDTQPNAEKSAEIPAETKEAK